MFSTLHQRSNGSQSQTVPPRFRDTLRGLFRSIDSRDTNNTEELPDFPHSDKHDLGASIDWLEPIKIDALSLDTLVDSDNDPAAISANPFDFGFPQTYDASNGNSNGIRPYSRSNSFAVDSCKDTVREKHFDTIDLRQHKPVLPQQQYSGPQNFNEAPMDNWLESSESPLLFDRAWSDLQSAQYTNTSPDQSSPYNHQRTDIGNFLDSAIGPPTDTRSSLMDSAGRSISLSGGQGIRSAQTHSAFNLNGLNCEVSLSQLANPPDIILNPYESLKISEEMDSFYHDIENRIFSVSSVEFQRKFRILEIKLHTVMKGLTLAPTDFNIIWRDYMRHFMALVDHTYSWIWTENLILPLLYVVSCKCPDKHTRSNCLQAFRDICLIARDVVNRSGSFEMKGIFLGSFWDSFVVAMLVNHDTTNTLSFEALKDIVSKFGADECVYAKLMNMRDVFGQNFDQLFFVEDRTEYRGHHYELMTTFLAHSSSLSDLINPMRMSFINDLVGWMGKEQNPTMLWFLERSVKKYGDPVVLSNLQNNLWVFSRESRLRITSDGSIDTRKLPSRNFSKPFESTVGRTKYQQESTLPESSLSHLRRSLSPNKNRGRRRVLTSKLTQIYSSRAFSPSKSSSNLVASSSSSNLHRESMITADDGATVRRRPRKNSIRGGIRDFYNQAKEQ